MTAHKTGDWRRNLSAAVLAWATLPLLAACPSPVIPDDACDNPRDARDWYSPNPDWRAGVPIRDYTVNTRVPELAWASYEGASAQAMRIRPLVPAMLKAQIKGGLVPTNATDRSVAKLLAFDAARERNEAVRRVSVYGLDEDVSDVTNVSFKVKASVRGAGRDFRFDTGLGVVDSAKAKGRPVADGFVQYDLAVSPGAGRRLWNVAVTVDPLDSADAEQEFIFIDLVYRHAHPFAYVKDLAPRRWAVADGTKPIGGLYAYMNAADAAARAADGVEVTPLPLAGWKPGNANGCVTVEDVTAKVGGRDVPAVRFTVTHCAANNVCMRCPVRLDGLKFTTLSLLYKIEVPEGSKALGDGEVCDVGWFSGNYNAYFDNFCLSYSSRTCDVMDWPGYGVARCGSAWMRQRDEKGPEGWNVLGWDTRNDDMTGNKDFSVDAVTDWVFYYAAQKIPEGQKVVVTIANPKAASGIMKTGGDMARWRATRNAVRSIDYGAKLERDAFAAPAAGRLAQPLEVMREGVFTGEIVVSDGWTPAPQVRRFAAEELVRLITLVCAPLNVVKVLDTPSTNDNVKIFVGGGWEGSRRLTKEQKALLEADAKTLKGTCGAAFRAFGKDLYIFGGDFAYRPGNGGFPGPDLGARNGVYLFMENNTDLIQAGVGPFRWTEDGNAPLDGLDYVYTRPKDGNWSLTWGDDYRLAIPFRAAGIGGVAALNTARGLGNLCSWHYNAAEARMGFLRQKSVNHWFSYGAGISTSHFYDVDEPADWRTPNDKWGLNAGGKRMVPGCYTSQPCLVNVQEDAKHDYATCVMRRLVDPGWEDAWQWSVTDHIALWPEDNYNLCQCPKCLAPIRLPGGERILNTESGFRTTQFYLHANALVQAYNVYVCPDQKMEPIAYFWMFPVPRAPVSRMLVPKLAPYIRVDYKQPIYAPVNDRFWRQYVRWSQLLPEFGQYEYALGMEFRPWCDVAKLDLAAERAAGVDLFWYEGDGRRAWLMERWVLGRLLVCPDADPVQLRKYYIARTYREAAPDMERFYFTLEKSYYDDPIQVDFEDDGEHRMGLRALWSRPTHPGLLGGPKNLAEELTGYLDDAVRHVRNPLARRYVEEVRTNWLAYLAVAEKKNGQR